MTPKPLTTILAATLPPAATIAMGIAFASLIVAPTAASPYCTALSQPETLPSREAKLAPIHSSTETGWIFTEGMLTETYAMKAEAQTLVTEIVAGFTARGVPLAILIAPPRSIVAGQEIVDATAGADLHDTATARASFDQLIAQLQSTGATVPNLAATATDNADTRGSFVFKRDTHWTALGAAMSAQALAEALAQSGADIAHPGPLPTGTKIAQEKGSLAEIIRRICKTNPAPEPFTLLDFPTRSTDLLGDAPNMPPVTLLGTSYSNRYKNDFYRAGDALAWALGRDVRNLSESGTGMIGIIEGFVLTGGLGTVPELVIWETPATENFNSISSLRQLLGAVHLANTHPARTLSSHAPGDTITLGKDQPDLVVIETATSAPIKLRLRLTLTDGATKTLTLRRRDRVPAELRSTRIAASLRGYDSDIETLTVEIMSGAQAPGATVTLLQTEQDGA